MDRSSFEWSRCDADEYPPRNHENILCFASLLLLTPLGCGGNNGGTGSTTYGTSSTTTGDTDDTAQPTTGNVSVPTPTVNGNCGEVLGFRTECYQQSAFIKWFHEDNETIAQVIQNILPGGNGSPFWYACCESDAPEVNADAACADRCQRLACEAALSNHLDLAEQAAGFFNNCADFASENPKCGFDMNACLAGTWHEQEIDLLFGSSSYWTSAACSGVTTNEVYIDDKFDWNHSPPIAGTTFPPMCDDRPSPDSTPGNVVPDDIAVEDVGLNAAVTWTLAGNTYSEASQDAELHLAYDLHDCSNQARCVDLAELRVELPAMTVQGISIQNAHLSIYQVDSQPPLLASGGFSYGPGTLHAIMSASADGIPIVLEGPNTGTATGLLAPASGSMALSGLQFDYSDSVIAASLQLDIVGEYTVRGPTAVIMPAVVPRACVDPVTFRAASFDPDNQSLSHLWWMPGLLTESGATLDVVLTAGTHTIGLISQDTDGRLDATAIQYTRTCL